MAITKDELRELICYYKDEKHLTFEAISEKLDEMYGIKRDRQSIYGIYKRYMDKLERDKEISRADVDIINIAARVTVFSTAKKLICELNDNISDNYIKSTMEKYKDDIQLAREEMIDIISDGIRIGATKEEIMESISYKGITPIEKVYVQLATESFKKRIIENIEMDIAHSISHNGNNGIAKELLKLFPTGNSVTVIKNKYT